jgi:fructose-1,6-bisphosphatase-3
MATFERYFLTDTETYKEEKGYYFLLRDSEEVCDRILDAFGVKGKNRHIINGHVPVHAAEGENPIKADGRLMVIDGGFSQAYHKTTGIAGYTLIYNSHGLQLVQHEPFESKEKAVQEGSDIHSRVQLEEFKYHRMLVRDTDRGKELMVQIENLRKLIMAYRQGLIKEK